MILWGPPGTGKTSFAKLLSEKVRVRWISVNAVDTGAKELKKIGTEAKKRKLELSEKTIFFIDEIHRLNRAQQDVLLPFLEVNDFILLGATTENPSYELVPALLSRVKVFVFTQLNEKDLKTVAKKSLQKLDLTVSKVFEDEAFEKLIDISKGDARSLLNSLEWITSSKDVFSKKPIDLETLNELLSFSPNYYGGKKEEHYNSISAFIKSMRGSDPDASLYYLARMLEGGEDPVFIARRMVIFASEDISNADPRALTFGRKHSSGRSSCWTSRVRYKPSSSYNLFSFCS